MTRFLTLGVHAACIIKGLVLLLLLFKFVIPSKVGVAIATVNRDAPGEFLCAVILDRLLGSLDP
jgi:hypothetical protein